MERQVLVAGDPRLRGRAQPVAAITPDIRDAIADVVDTLAAVRARHGFGRALAAPQIGIAKRIIAVDLGAGPFAVVNPEIRARSDDTFEVWDDCFSVPDELVRVRRHASVTIEYRDARFRDRLWRDLPRDLAELMQHELDHLDGVLMTDRALERRPAAERTGLIERPRHRLSLDGIAAAARAIDPVFVDSPTLVCEPLSARIALKIETLNPIRAFKGRGTSWFAAGLATPGPLVCASAGNFGQGLAYACRARGIPLVVFAAVGANPLKLARMQALGAEVRLAGDDFDAAREAAAAWASSHGATLVIDGREPRIAEGAGTIARELLAGDAAYDAIVVPVGNGALIAGIARWMKARSPATRVIGVVSRGAPVMADAFAGRISTAGPPRTIADGIAVRVAVPEAVADLAGLVDDFVRVDDDQLIDAMRRVHRHAGLVVEPAGVAGLAALLADPDLGGTSAATVLCGGNLTPEQMRSWLLET
jgi:peptide deformylase